MDKIRIRIPATSANLGPGFDVLGVALSLFSDIEMAVQMGNKRLSAQLQVTMKGEGAAQLPCNASNLIVRAARVLSKSVRLQDVVFTSSRTAFVVHCLREKKYEWLGEAMEDVLHQPARARLIPGFFQILSNARKAGAWSAALSGAGSTMI